jgi:ABC-type phosphate transport system substrate-binding protein
MLPNWPNPDKSSVQSTSLIRAEDDDGVAIAIKRTPYSLGYISRPTAAKLRVPVALISNHAGTFVAPTTSGVQSAMDAFAAEMGLGGVNRSLFFQSIVDPKNQPGAYPISMFTYFVFDARKLGCSTLFDLVFLLHWVWTDSLAAELANPQNLVPVSATVRDLLTNRLANLQCRGSSVLRSVLKKTRPKCPDGTQMSLGHRPDAIWDVVR